MPEDHRDRLVTLEQLYAFRDKLEVLIARRGVQDPRSEAERHALIYGHRLTFGCCSESAVSGPSSAASVPPVSDGLT